MIVYVPILFLCFTNNDCRFYESTQYTTSEQACLEEVDEQIKRAEEQGIKAYGMCADFSLPKGKLI